MVEKKDNYIFVEVLRCMVYMQPIPVLSQSSNGLPLIARCSPGGSGQHRWAWEAAEHARVEHVIAGTPSAQFPWPSHWMWLFAQEFLGEDPRPPNHHLRAPPKKKGKGKPLKQYFPYVIE